MRELIAMIVFFLIFFLVLFVVVLGIVLGMGWLASNVLPLSFFEASVLSSIAGFIALWILVRVVGAALSMAEEDEEDTDVIGLKDEEVEIVLGTISQKLKASSRKKKRW